jgi:hypothetical protein
MPYVALGVVLCLGVQIIFWLQLVAYRPRVLTLPFIFAYSQKAMVDLIVYEPPWFLTAALWLIGYVLLGLLLWLLLDRRDITSAGRWRRAAVGWFSIQGCVAVLAWLLLTWGTIRIE